MSIRSRDGSSAPRKAPEANSPGAAQSAGKRTWRSSALHCVPDSAAAMSIGPGRRCRQCLNRGDVIPRRHRHPFPPPRSGRKRVGRTVGRDFARSNWQWPAGLMDRRSTDIWPHDALSMGLFGQARIRGPVHAASGASCGETALPMPYVALTAQPAPLRSRSRLCRVQGCRYSTSRNRAPLRNGHRARRHRRARLLQRIFRLAALDCRVAAAGGQRPGAGGDDARHVARLGIGMDLDAGATITGTATAGAHPL